MKRLVGIASLVLVVIFAATVSAVAQTAPTTMKDDKLKQPIVLDFKDTPISTALQVLFNGTGMNYVIENTVSGNVKNMHIEVPFEQALKALLKSVDPPLVYKKDPGSDVYIISVKKPEPPPDLTAPIIDTNPIVEDTAASEDQIIEKISLNFLDAYEVKALIEGQDSRGGNGAGGWGGGGWGGGGFGGGFGNNNSFGGGFGNSSFGGGFGNNSWGNNNNSWGNNNNNSWGNRNSSFGNNSSFGGFNRGW